MFVCLFVYNHRSSEFMIKGFGTWSETDILLPPSRVSKFWKTVYQTKQYSNRTLVLLSALINRRFFKAREQLITVPYWRQNIHQQAREIEIMAKNKNILFNRLSASRIVHVLHFKVTQGVCATIAEDFRHKNDVQCHVLHWKRLDDIFLRQGILQSQ